MISEQYRKDDTTKITHRTNSTTKNTIRMWMHMRHKCEIRAIARLEEESHAGDKSEHHAFVVWICEADGDEEGAGCDADEGDPGVLEPEVFGDFGVEKVGYYAA